MEQINLTNSNEDFAVFLPAISGIYAKFMSDYQANKLPPERIPQGLPKGLDSLKFLNENDGLFTYKWGLYSAGHAELDINNTNEREAYIQKRDRSKNIILGDSGGFQVAKGILKFDWDNFYTPGHKNDEVRMKILKWLEHTSDWSMILDVPSFSVTLNIGVNTITDCLKYTVYNNEFFMKHRTPGATKFLNVLQGNDIPSADDWYEAVKPFSDTKLYGDKAFEGWAMGGENMRWWKLICYRLIKMRDEGMLDGKDWIHFLGTSALTAAVQLTALKRELVKVNPNLEVSFDCASPFVSVAKGQVYTKNEFDQVKKNPRFGYNMDVAKDHKDYAHGTDPYISKKELWNLDVHNSPVMQCFKEGDICVKGHDMESKSSWDSLSYVLIMAHNVYQHIDAVQEANRLCDSRNFDKVPSKTIEFCDFVKELFVSEKPMQMIEDNSGLLNKLSTAKFTGAPRTSTLEHLVEDVPDMMKLPKTEKKEFEQNTFGSLFE